MMTDQQSASIRLDQFLKLQGVSGTGGQAKRMIQDGEVTVNGQVETRRAHKLQLGDTVVVDGMVFKVE